MTETDAHEPRARQADDPDSEVSRSGPGAAPGPALDGLVRLAASLCGAPTGLITLVDGARQLFQASVGFDGPDTAPLEAGFCPIVVARREPLVIPDTLADPDHATNVASAAGVRFYAGVPLLSGEGQAFGTLCVLDRVPRPAGLAPAQLDMLRTLAMQVVSQFELRRSLAQQDTLLAEQRATLRERAALARAQAAIATSAGDPDTILAALVDSAMAAIPSADGAALGLVEAEALRVGAAGGTLAALQGTRLDLRGSLAERCIRAGTPMLLDDVPDLAIAARAAVLAPVLRGDRVVGVLVLRSGRPGAFRPRDRDTAALFAGEAVVGLTEARATEAQRRARIGIERQRAILDRATDLAIIATGADGRVTDWNTGAARILGWSADEMLGEGLDRIFTPEDRLADRPAAEMRKARQEGRASDERWHMRRDGSRFRASGEMIVLNDAGGVPVGFMKLLRDRTDEHRADAALREAEQALQRAQVVGGVGLFSVETRDNVLNATPEFCRLFGVAVRPTIAPDEIEALVLPEDAPRVARAAGRGPDGTVPDVEFRIRRADTGELRWISRRAEIERDASGRPARFFGAVRDITAQRLALDALAASELRYRALFDAIDDGFCIIEFRDGPHGPLSDYVHVEANAGYERHTGIPDVVGRTVRDIAAGQAAEWVALYGDVLRSGRPVRFEREFAAVGRHIEVSAARVDPPERRQVSVLFRDITARKRAEASLLALNGTLEQRVAERTAELMQAEERLRQSQKMEAVGQLTGGLAHDFNNLLTGITGSLELLAARIAQGRVADVDRYVAAAQGAADRAAALTHRLLAFSRRQTLDPRPTDVNRLIAGMEELIRRTVGPGIAIEVVGAAGLWPTLVDPPQLENALLNLCINARDAMPDGGRLTIETTNRCLDEETAREQDLPPGQYVSLCVADTGSGMAPDVIAKAFDPFFTTKPLGQGTGLGLSMIYGFVRQSGGQARISSEAGQGTTVCLHLPRHSGGGEVAERALELGAAPRAEQGETVLVVDDEPTVRMLVLDVLEELGYAALEAADGASGLRMLQSDVRVDLLVTDVGLPGGMNGRQMADAARVGRPELRVLFITGYAENAALGSGQLEPGMHVLTKPFPLETLAGRIRELITAR